MNHYLPRVVGERHSHSVVLILCGPHTILGKIVLDLNIFMTHVHNMSDGVMNRGFANKKILFIIHIVDEPWIICRLSYGSK